MHTRPYIVSLGILMNRCDTYPVPLSIKQALHLINDLLIGLAFRDAGGEGGCICVDLKCVNVRFIITRR